eukprot:GFUD01030893.1.p1 GENE.GFUD01030893.1~~GFUD01030893.1.p1  ORF type:complete len:480 (+),score=169.01 GFUD01030893.1:127-1566(+)
MSTPTITSSALDKLVTLLTPHLELVNTCMVDMIEQDLFSLLAVQVQSELLSMTEDQLGRLPALLFTARDISKEAPEVDSMLDQLRRHTLEVLDLVKDSNLEMDTSMLEFWDKIMPEKKTHEVCQMSKLVIKSVKNNNIGCLVDLGSGKAYLSQVLATLHSIPVVAIDSQEGNTRGAEIREKNLKVKWQGLKVRAVERMEGKSPSNRKKRGKGGKSKDTLEVPREKVESTKDLETSDNLLVPLTQFVEEGSDIGELVEKQFPGKSNNFGLIGLHTCGNLAPTSLRTFLSSPGAKFLCNVGCCYNHLTQDSPNQGFPLSHHLLSQHFTLGRSARMLAVQPLDRLATSNTLPNKSLLWRAVLEIILARVAPSLPKEKRIIGRIATKSNNFVDYARKAFVKLKVETEISDEELLDIFDKNKNKFGAKLQCLYQYRALFSPLVEAVILTDRLLFLQEQGVSNSSLVRLFDRTISPRSYAIVATK